MLNPLDRDQADYVWAMTEWLKCTTLDMEEKSIVAELLAAALVSVEEFDVVRHIVTQGFFYHILQSAIVKARREGIGREW